MANIKEIAKLAGVSKATVSRVINNKLDVKQETRERILELLRRYDFQPNASAQAISRKSVMNTLGLIIPYDANYIFANPFNTEIMRGVALATNAAGYHLLFCHHAKEDYVSAFKQKKVAGFVLVSPNREHKTMVDRLTEIGAPFVSTARIPQAPGIHFVEVDNVHGAFLAVEHLIRLGHRRIGMIKGHNVLASSEDRFTGYRAALERYRIAYDEVLIREGAASIDSGHAAMLDLLRHTDATAVFAGSDLMAIGAVGAAAQLGKSVPGDVSVIGFDNIPLAGSLNPPLTTIDQQACAKGEIAAGMLIDLIEGRQAAPPPDIAVRLVVRKSTGAWSA